MSMVSAESPVDYPRLIEDIILHEDDLTAQTKTQFPYHIEILNAFQLYRRTLLENDKLTRHGRHVLLLTLDEMYATCKKVLNYVSVNTELFCSNLPKFNPLVICGLPRTGSTLLYNLLACDFDCRAPLHTDMSVECIPPIRRSDIVEHECRAIAAKSAQQLREQLTDRESIYSASHPIYPIEEDFLILHQAGICNPLTFVNPVHHIDLDAWFYNEKNKDFAYNYHNMFLRMLNSVDEPRSH